MDDIAAREDQLIADFLKTKQDKSNSLLDNTFVTYSRVFSKIWYPIRVVWGCKICQVSRSQLRAAIAKMRKEGYNNSSIHLFFAILSSYFQFLVRDELIAKNPVHGLELPKLNEVPAIHLTEQEQKDFLNRLQSYLTLDREDYYQEIMLILVAIMSGTRVIEQSRLNLSDFNFEKGRLIILGKGSKKRESVIQHDPFFIEIYSHFLEERSTRIGLMISRLQKRTSAFSNEEERIALEKRIETLRRQDAFFINRVGKRLGVRDIQRRVKSYRERFQMLKPITPHKFRHTFCTTLSRANVNQRIIQGLAGHASGRTTERYTHPTTEDAETIINNIQSFKFDH